MFNATHKLRSVPSADGRTDQSNDGHQQSVPERKVQVQNLYVPDYAAPQAGVAVILAAILVAQTRTDFEAF